MRRSTQILAIAAMTAVFISGCSSITKDVQRNADGTSRLKERGNILVLGNWNYDRTLDEQGTVVKRNDYNELFPLFKLHVVEDAESVKTDGYALLLFTFDDTKPKKRVDAPEAQTVSQ
jgi:hypothetical protein